MITLYCCECGKEFTTPNSFNGHKSHCKIHLEFCGKLETRKQQYKDSAQKVKEHWVKQNSVKSAENLSMWLSEQHTCQRCGKVMTKKYGSGIFCSQNCANSREHTSDTKNKIKTSIQKTSNKKQELKKLEYNNKPNLCIICGSVLPYNKRHNKVCSVECQRRFQSDYMLKRCSEQDGVNNCGKGKRGWYKGYWCQSSWELAFVIYCLDNNIAITRNKEGFKYFYDKKERTYYPDFILTETNTYVEIKGWYDPKSQEKLKQFPLTIVLYDESKMHPILHYVEHTYGKEFFNLYDTSYV